MSATRRAGSETNILAMLDRQASGALPQRILRGVLAMPAVFWYGAAGVLVCGLVATLAWLARDIGASSAVDAALIGSTTPAATRAAEVAAALPASAESVSVTANVPVSAPASVAASMADPAPAPVSDARPKAGATIVNVAPVAPTAPAELAVQAPAAPAPASVAAAAALPRRQQSGRITPRDVQRDPQRLATHAATARTATPRTAEKGKAASAGARPAALVHAAPAKAAHSRRPAAPARPAAPSVDTDVALISAIIQHAASRQETEEAACADKACGPRMPAKP